MKQTSVEWYFEQIRKEEYEEDIDWYGLLQQAKAMEKQQIIQARITSPLLASIDKDDYIKEAEQYYNETYSSERTESVKSE